MDHADDSGGPKEVVRILDFLFHEEKKLGDLHLAAEVVVEAMMERLDRLRVLCNVSGAVSGPWLLPATGAKVRAKGAPMAKHQIASDPETEDQLRRAAEFGAEYKLMPLASGSGYVSIDGRQKLYLPGRQFKLMSILLDVDHAAALSGGERGWRLAKDVCLKMGGENGKPVSNANMDTIVWRLRKALREHQENEYLLQTRKGPGWEKREIRLVRKTEW